MSINSLFEISQRSFRALNAKMDATGQNIANSDSEGYRRRRATLEAASSTTSGRYTSPVQNQTPGEGPSIASYERVRSRILDQSAAEAQTGKSGAREEARILSSLEGVLATDTDRSLTSSLEGFFDGFNDLANDPEGKGAREAVLEKGKALTNEFNRLDQKVGEVADNTASALSESIDEANGLIEKVAGLNKTISEARAGGTPDLAAEDRRDALVKKLSGFAPVKTQENADGEYTLSIDGVNVVQGQETTLLRADNLQQQAEERQQPPKDVASVEFGNTGVAFQPGNEDAGEIGAQLRALNQTLPDVQGQLDDLAEKVVKEVNSVHRNGTDLNGDTNEPFFFNPSGEAPSASTIRLDDSVQGPDDIAAVDRDFSDSLAASKVNGDFTSGGATNIVAELEDTTTNLDTRTGDVGADLKSSGESLADGLSGGDFDISVKDNTGANLDFKVEKGGEVLRTETINVGTSLGSPSKTLTLEEGDGSNEIVLDVGSTFKKGSVKPSDGTMEFSITVEEPALPGDTTPAQDIAGLSDTLTPESIELASGVGSKVQQAAAREEAKAATADHMESMAEGISDVSVDEEMSNLIEQQQQFAASARVLRTAREVTSALLSI